MESIKYRDLFNRITACIEQWIDSDPSDFEYTPYLLVDLLEDELEVAIIDIDEPSESLYKFEDLTEMYVDTNTRQIASCVRYDAVHAITRKWCLPKTAAETNDYSVPKTWTEAGLIEFCERFRDVIASGNVNGSPDVCVRYAVRDRMFHVASFGDFFFFEDKLYVIDQDPRWEPYHDEFAFKAILGPDCERHGYAHAVAFCGIQTPFMDDRGDFLFTGDICIDYTLRDEFRSLTSHEHGGYGFIGDNHFCPIDMKCFYKPLHRVGTIFYNLSLKEPMKTTWTTEIHGMWGQAPDISYKLMKARLTPCFRQEDKFYIVLSMIEKEFEWHKIFDSTEAYPEPKNELRRITPNKIEELEPDQIFVFNSNKAGKHCGGAARCAHKHFSAEWGVGEGLTGQCYAIPTMEGEKSFHEAVETFTWFARQHPDLMFFVTAVGCGIAGYTAEQVAPWFAEAAQLENVYLPLSFLEQLNL